MPVKRAIVGAKASHCVRISSGREALDRGDQAVRLVDRVAAGGAELLVEDLHRIGSSTMRS